LAISVDQRDVKAFRGDVNSMLSDVSVVIASNIRELEAESWRRADAKYSDAVRAASTNELLRVFMSYTLSASPEATKELVQRVLADRTELSRTVDTLVSTCRGRPHNVFRVEALSALLQIHESGVTIPKTSYVRSLADGIREVAESNVRYCRSVALHNALCHLDNATLRIAKKFGQYFELPHVRTLVAELEASMSREDWILERRTVTRELLEVVDWIAETLWRDYSRADAPIIYDAVWTLEKVEELLERLPPAPYPPSERDLLGFEYFGNGRDLLRMGSWAVMQQHIERLASLNLPDDVRSFAESDLESIAWVPKPPRPPDDWAPVFTKGRLLPILATYVLGGAFSAGPA
jgi:hypothetical protein